MTRNFAALAAELEANNRTCHGGTHPDIIRAAAALREADQAIDALRKGEHLQERQSLTMAGVAALCGVQNYQPRDFGDGLTFSTEVELMAFVGKIERACRQPGA
jgi:hypothetical protein